MAIPPRITQLWVIVAYDTDTDRDEGIPAVMHGPLLGALFSADPSRVEHLRALARNNAARYAVDGKKLILARFSVREDLETFEP